MNLKIFRTKILSSTLIAFLILVACFQIANSQVTRRKPPTETKTSKPVFAGNSVRQKNPEEDKSGTKWTPKSLTMAEKSEAFVNVMTAAGITVNAENFPVAKYAVLDSKTPYIENKAFLVVYAYVGFNPLATYLNIRDGELRVNVKPDKINGWYLLDCNVHGLGSEAFINPPYEITGPDGKTDEISNTGIDHLQMFMISKNTEWQTFTIKRKSEFWLAACEISTPGN